MAGGFKYALFVDEEDGTLVTGGLTYEMTNGSRNVLQGNGDGMWRPFVSGAWQLEDLNFISSIAASVPGDSSEESTSFDWHMHLSLPALDENGDVIPLFEVNGIHYTKDGRTTPVDFEGVDYANLGSTDVKGNDIITGALGLRFRLGELSWLGATYERPLTSRNDVFGQRFTIDWMRRF